MDKRKIIRIVCATGVALTTFLLTGFLAYIFMMQVLGNTSYAAYTPLALPLQLLSSLISIRIFTYSEDSYREDDEDPEYDEYMTEQTDEPTEGQINIPEYPEFFSGEVEEEKSGYAPPDIKEFIRQQKAEYEPEVQETDIVDDDFLNSFKNNSKADEEKSLLYNDIPTELPEDYVPYEEETEDEAYDYDDEYEELPRIHPLISRITLTIASAALAILLPINFATVYTPGSVIIRRPFSVKEYSLKEANSYSVGVKLSGDVSMKVSFSDGSQKELIFSGTAHKSKQFANNYSSQYGYAAFCDRLLQESGIEKSLGDLTSLSPSPALSDSDIAYIEEITESDLTDISNN